MHSLWHWMSHELIFCNIQNLYKLKISSAVPDYNIENPAWYSRKTLEPELCNTGMCVQWWPTLCQPHAPLIGWPYITHLEPDIQECEVKWALGSIITNKASGGDGIPVELFQILKDDDVKVLHSICQQIWKTQQWPQDWKRSVFTPIPKKGNARECSNYCTTALISHASNCC